MSSCIANWCMILSYCGRCQPTRGHHTKLSTSLNISLRSTCWLTAVLHSNLESVTNTQTNSSTFVQMKLFCNLLRQLNRKFLLMCCILLFLSILQIFFEAGFAENENSAELSYKETHSPTVKRCFEKYYRLQTQNAATAKVALPAWNCYYCSTRATPDNTVNILVFA